MRLTMLILVILLVIGQLFATEVEVIEKRSFYTKTYCVDADSSKYKTTFSYLPLHYLDTTNVFVEIPTSGASRDSLVSLAETQYENRTESYHFEDWDCNGEKSVLSAQSGAPPLTTYFSSVTTVLSSTMMVILSPVWTAAQT